MGAKAGPEQNTRVLRVAEAVRKELALLFAEDVKDPGAAGAVVTRVEMAKDLRSARIRVRLLEGGDDAERRRVLIAALGRATGMLRREVTQRLGLRSAPQMHFLYDEGPDDRMRVEHLLAEIEAERRSR